MPANTDIPAHAPPSTRHAEETLEDYLVDKERVPDIIARNPKVAGVMFETYLQAAVLADLLAKPRDLAVSCLDLALDAGVAAFQLAAGTGTVTVTIAGRELGVPATGATDSTHPATWQRLFGLTLALRRTAGTDTICGFDIELFRSSSAQVDEYRYEVVAAMQAFWTGGDWRAAAARVYERSQPQFTRVGGNEYVDVDVTQVKMLEPLDSLDARAFNTALAASIAAHGKYWSSKRVAGEVIGRIALTPLGLAVLALDRGIPIEITSGYMPRWLLRGGS